MSRLITEARAAHLALGLLTRLPLPPARPLDPSRHGHSLHYYPLAGLVMGAILALAQLLLAAGGDLLVAAVLVAAWVALTGALHLDGLADSADAWVGGMGDRERTLAILKDPACGPLGVTAVVLVLLLKVAALEHLLAAGVGGWWLAPLVARTVLPLAFLVLPYVRAGGMGGHLADGASPPALAVATGLALALTGLWLPPGHWWLWLSVAVLMLIVWRGAMSRRLGGFTGDGAGALVEVLETALLLASALLAGAHA